MLKYLLQKEFLQIRRNPFLPKLIFVFPIVVGDESGSEKHPCQCG